MSLLSLLVSVESHNDTHCYYMKKSQLRRLLLKVLWKTQSHTGEGE